MIKISIPSIDKITLGIELEPKIIMALIGLIVILRSFRLLNPNKVRG